MTVEFLQDQRSLQQEALNLLSLADCVAEEGWSETVAVQLRQAAHDLLGMAADPSANSATRHRPRAATANRRGRY